MTSRLKILLLTLISLILSSCSEEVQSATPSLTVFLQKSTTSTESISRVDTPTFTTKPTYTQDSEIRKTERGEIFSISISPDGEILVVATSIGVWAYRLSDGEILHFQAGDPAIKIPYSQVADIIWSPDGTCLAVSQNDNGIWIWDFNTWELLTKRKGENWWDAKGNPGFAWAPDGKNLALGTGNGGTWIWNKATNTWVQKENKLRDIGWQLSILWKNDGTLLTLIDNELYNVETGELVNKIFVYIDGIGRVVWSPNESHIYFLFDLGGGLVDVEKNEHLFGCCNIFSWSQDGQYIATYSSWNSTIYVFDTTTNNIIFEEEKKDILYALVWTPNDELLFAGYYEGVLVLQNIYTNEVLLDLSAHDNIER